MVGIYKGVKRKVSENRVAKTGLPYCCPMVFCGSPIFPLPTIRIPPTFFFYTILRILKLEFFCWVVNYFNYFVEMYVHWLFGSMSCAC